MTRIGMTMITVEQVPTLFMHPRELGVIGLHALSLVEVREPKPAPVNVLVPKMVAIHAMKWVLNQVKLRVGIVQHLPAGTTGVNGANGVFPVEVWQPNLALALAKHQT